MRLTALVLLLLPTLGYAATPIDQVRPLDPTGRVEIENLKGRIQVRAWERPEVRITGSLGDGVEALVIEGDRKQLEVLVRYPRNSGRRGDRSEPTELVLMVPLRASLEIETVSADVDVQGVASGTLDVDSVSGTVVVVGAPGQIGVDSVSGDVRLTVNSALVSAESVSGDLVLRGRMSGDISAEAVSGNIDAQVNQERLRKFEASTVSGDIALDTALAEGGNAQLESVSGRITAIFPQTLSARARGTSMSGKLRAPGATVSKPRYGPGSSFDTRYGSGNGDITIETLSGNAELRLK